MGAYQPKTTPHRPVSSYLFVGFGDSPAAPAMANLPATFRCDWDRLGVYEISRLWFCWEKPGMGLGWDEKPINSAKMDKVGVHYFRKATPIQGHWQGKWWSTYINLNKLPQNSNAVHKKMPITCRSTHVPWSKHHGLLGFIGYGPVIHPMGILTMRTHAWDKSMVNMDCAAFHRFEMINHKMTKDAETSRSHATKKWCNVFGMSVSQHGKITSETSPRRSRGAQAPGAPRSRQNPTRNGYRLYTIWLFNIAMENPL